MVKRFMIGFVVGLGLMYYYLHHMDETVEDATQWGTKAASSYRGDKHKSLADEVLEKHKVDQGR
jgi:hypothetical protein